MSSEVPFTKGSEDMVYTFVHEFNNKRLHEALDMKYPADVYKPSDSLTNASKCCAICRYAVYWIQHSGA